MDPCLSEALKLAGHWIEHPPFVPNLENKPPALQYDISASEYITNYDSDSGR
jgi:hypothetical protein